MQINAVFTTGAFLAVVSAYTLERSCSQDFYPERRAFTLATTSSESMTFELCRDFCKGKGADAFGLEFSKECYCAAPGEYAALRAASNTCSKPCSGNPTTLCGGDNALQVYTFETAPAATYLGCARDYFPDSRVLTGVYYQDDGDNSNAKCQDFCFSNGYPLAGTEFGDECFCGSASDRSNLVWADNCDETCTSGNGICGGDNAISIWTMDAQVPPMISSSVPPYVRSSSTSAASSSAAVVPTIAPASTTVDVRSTTASSSAAILLASSSAGQSSSSVAVSSKEATTSIVSTSLAAQITTSTSAAISTKTSTTSALATTAQASTLTTSTKAAATSAAPGTTKLCFVSFEINEIFKVISLGGALLDLLSDAFDGTRALVLAKVNMSSTAPISHVTTIPGCPTSKTLNVQFYYKSSLLFVGRTCSLVATAGDSSTTVPIIRANPWTKVNFQSTSTISNLDLKFELKCTGALGIPLQAPVHVDSVTISY
ncbi:hypothetical protein BCR37DRAFT_391344 [Protomyces lactucae-debilis]|uniref:WSC domain-containing protein n=1 Tax=Protomyces lactucae-debilis TaxID=2754530 RepID=A0A1Y2FQH6_PROLT|nr:uncharacterized protein BCR37DRAFT_391344 [Protomyces lactucae-debilis]ORY85574.1 hypothetical protein BCR37DRAFT_391344 [Protomyces lactucae-debilis]